MNRRAFYFATRGWVLALLFLCLVWYRALSLAPLHWEMLILVVAGAALRAWAGAHLGLHGNGSEAIAPTLVQTGPYSFSRNPLYLSNIAMGAGLLFFANALPSLDVVLILLFLTAHHFNLVRWEENRLRTLWPKEYGEYSQTVPRWFGFKPPAPLDSSGTPPHPEWRAVLQRQGRNLAYAFVCVLILWAASRYSAVSSS